MHVFRTERFLANRAFIIFSRAHRLYKAENSYNNNKYNCAGKYVINSAKHSCILKCARCINMLSGIIAIRRCCYFCCGCMIDFVHIKSSVNKFIQYEFEHLSSYKSTVVQKGFVKDAKRLIFCQYGFSETTSGCFFCIQNILL